MAENQSEKWLTRARELIKIKTIEGGSFGKRPTGGCSRSRLELCDPPIKQVFGTHEKAFLFDETRCIPFVTKTFLNFAESIGHNELETPTEYDFYEKNAHIEDIDELIEMAIPVVARILEDENKLDGIGFNDKVNEGLCFEKITSEQVRRLASFVKSLKPPKTFNGFLRNKEVVK